MGWAVQDPQPALAAGPDAEELQSTVVPFSLDKRPRAGASSTAAGTAVCDAALHCLGGAPGRPFGQTSGSMNNFIIVMA